MSRPLAAVLAAAALGLAGCGSGAGAGHQGKVRTIAVPSAAGHPCFVGAALPTCSLYPCPGFVTPGGVEVRPGIEVVRKRCDPARPPR